MKTVKDYLDKGLVFVGRDLIRACNDRVIPVGHRVLGVYIDCFVDEFAWRTNTGLTPAFAGLVDAVHGDTTISGAKIDDLNWGGDVSIDKWRPHLPATETKSPYDVAAHVSDASISKDSSDIVKKPSHYQVFDGIESIQIIASSMTEEGFKGFCFGNTLKYRLRAGGKDDTQQEIDKANFYKELFENHKHLCRSNNL